MKMKNTAIDSIKKIFICLNQIKPYLTLTPLAMLNISESVLKQCYQLEIKSLWKLEKAINILSDNYDENDAFIVELSQQLKISLNKYLFFDIDEAIVDLDNGKFIATSSSYYINVFTKNGKNIVEKDFVVYPQEFKKGKYVKVINEEEKLIKRVGVIKKIEKEIGSITLDDGEKYSYKNCFLIKSEFYDRVVNAEPMFLPKKSECEKIAEIIDKRSKDTCCLCMSFDEMTKINGNIFISLMKKHYPLINDKTLSHEKIDSWRDEYKQITKHFIPIFLKHDITILNYFIMFELKLAKYTTDFSKKEYVYADAVVVGDKGFVVLEFKQRDANVAKYYWGQATKYMKRLKYHNICCKQPIKYTYMVCTLEPINNIWYFDDVKNFFFGNSKSIADDMCCAFFNKVEPYYDIEEWLNAGFSEKPKK